MRSGDNRLNNNPSKDINSLFSILSEPETDDIPLFERRPDSIHLFGTDDMSTDDILEYFSEFGPHHIEWIDDSHCKFSRRDQFSGRVPGSVLISHDTPILALL